jgi:divalent metal cation (Fe/Co/Zn/Cd) transporter
MVLINDKIDGLVRHAITFGAGFLVSGGYITADSVAGIVTAIMTLATVIWSVAAKKKAG